MAGAVDATGADGGARFGGVDRAQYLKVWADRNCPRRAIEGNAGQIQQCQPLAQAQQQAAGGAHRERCHLLLQAQCEHAARPPAAPTGHRKGHGRRLLLRPVLPAV